jgi:small subunit ribosomal protein S8
MDQIAQMFSKIKNAANAGKKETKVSYSKLSLAVLEILKKENFIESFAEIKDANKKYPAGITVKLKYKNKDEATFQNLRKVSTPGKRVYLKASRINQIFRGKTVIVSTSQGLMSGADARKKGLGGELIGEVV